MLETNEEARLGHVELEALMNDWGAALISNDPEDIERFMATDWVIMGPSGTTEKAQFLSVVKSGDLTHDTFDFEISMTRIFGESALVTGRVKNTGQFRGEAFTSDEWASDVFVKSNGTWLCTFSQITPVSASGCD